MRNSRCKAIINDIKCNVRFEVEHEGHHWCCESHRAIYNLAKYEKMLITKERQREKALKADNKLKREKLAIRKEAIKPRSKWLKEAQTQFNKYIRLRDRQDPCISCGRHHEGQYHAGHYKTVGANPELRFEERNCHKQCAPCNNHLSGNIANYRPNLITKIGMEGVEWIEGPHEPLKLSIDEIKELIATYKDKIKELN